MKVDVDRIEELFSADEAKVVTKKKKEQPKTLLDAKRGQNLGIFMRGFKLPLQELDSRLNALPPDEGMPRAPTSDRRVHAWAGWHTIEIDPCRCAVRGIHYRAAQTGACPRRV